MAGAQEELAGLGKTSPFSSHSQAFEMFCSLLPFTSFE
jgi:hypothetical protein